MVWFDTAVSMQGVPAYVLRGKFQARQGNPLASGVSLVPFDVWPGEATEEGGGEARGLCFDRMAVAPPGLGPPCGVGESPSQSARW